MDALTKQHWVFLFKRLPSLASPHLPIHNEGWTLWDRPTKITSPSRPTLCGLIMDPVTQMWWVRHKRFPLVAKETVDWKACSEGMPALKPSRQRWITKHASANCGVGTTLVKWKCQDDDKCPRCSASEDTAHVLQCQAKGANEVWSESMMKLTTCLVESRTHPDLQRALLENLSRWRRGLLPRDDLEEAEVKQAAQSYFFQLGGECVLLLFLYYFSVLALHKSYAK